MASTGSMQFLLMLMLACGAAARARDTPLDRDFCGRYWAASAAQCDAVRAKVAVNHSTQLPILTLGDPAMPAMFFVHGWPDNAAEWANLFGSLCVDHFCVAPTLTKCVP